ncbi:reverse transcriptase domain-containing protein, partial [Tanacetum coccineum]
VLSKLASVAFNHLTKEILIEVLEAPPTERQEINAIMDEEEDNWMTPIIRCLEEGEIHMGTCGMHFAPRSVLAKAMRQGYYWLKMHRDAREEIKRCDSCQIPSPVLKLPKTIMTSIMASWPFFQWGMDVLGPFPEAPGKVKYVIIAIDYFTKWIEAKPLARTTGKEVKKFVWDNIVCRFGLPRIIVTDNETNFVNDRFKIWCKKLNIQQMNTTVAHPHANGLGKGQIRSL